MGKFRDAVDYKDLQRPQRPRSRRTKNLTGGIWLIFRGLNFSRNADIGQISHFWMGTI
jgi:hypothetical protein